MDHIGKAAGLSLALAILFSPLAGILARRYGAMARPRPDRHSERPTPLLGGMVILLAAFPPLYWFHEIPRELWGLLAGGFVIFGVGLVDDLRGLSPPQKLVGQFLAACTLVAVEVLVGGYAWGPLSIPIFLLWLVIITNAFNLLDNMDGLAGGVAVITAGIILIFTWGHGVSHVSLGAACIGAASLGFVLFNVPPARLFLGDNGSLFLGLVLASLAAKTGGGETASSWIIPVLLLGVPLFDTIFVVAGRTRAGRPITEGGTDHLSHRLLDFGLSPRKTLMVLYLLSAGMGGLILFVGKSFPLTLVIVGAVFAIALLGLGGFLSRPLGRFTDPSRPAASLVVFDLIAFSVAFIAAYLIRFDGEIPEPYLGIVTKSLPLFLGAKFLAFAAFGLYGPGAWSGARGATRILNASIVGSLLAVFIATMAWRFEEYSRAVFVIDGMITFLLVWGMRTATALVGETLAQVAGSDLRVALVGTAEALAVVGSTLAETEGKRARVVGALRISEDGAGTGGLDDLGPITDIAAATKKHGLRMIWLIGLGLQEDQRADIAEACVREGLIVREISIRLE
ncbi:MAG: hypothetical protein O7H41_17355 [Planctomycetota bacterium]|nr:hypothetical protein [Planctomycetota bacterium]